MKKNRIKFKDLYNDAKVIGAGSFGVVVSCRDKKTNNAIALKIAALDKDSPSFAVESLIRE